MLNILFFKLLISFYQRRPRLVTPPDLLPLRCSMRVRVRLTADSVVGQNCHQNACLACYRRLSVC